MSRCPGNHFIFSRYCQAIRVSTITLLFHLTFTAVSWGQTSPIYTWIKKADLPTVSGSTLNIEDLTLAVAIDRDQNIYTLSLENGIDKRDPDGNILQENLISGGLLDSPRDIAVDEAGFIYVADYIASGGTFTDDGKIRVFDPSGNYLPEKTIFTSFYRPLGLDVSEDKIFVAEYYDGLQGPEQGSTFSRVRIYDKNTKSVLRETKNVDIPLRIAVNSEGKIYVSQAGRVNTGVLIFDNNLTALGRLPNITSPGSVIVDALDFVHVIEYGSRVKFSDFINFDNLDFFEISSLAKDISDGVKNEEFFVKIFDPNSTFTGIILEQLDFPVDLAQKECGPFYVNNSEIFDGSFWGMYVPSKLEFDLEIYERAPSIDAVEAPLITCPEPIEVNLQPGETTATVTFDAPTAIDACGAEVRQTAGMPSGSDFPVGENIIEYTAEDAAGNTSVCSFTITLLQNEDLDPPQIQCPADVSLTASATECTAVVEYEMPEATDDSGQVELALISGPSIGTAIGVGDYIVKYQATDAGGNSATCEFAITVRDAAVPVITNCPEDQQEVLTSEGFLLPDYTQDLLIEDCSQVTVEQVPAAGTFLTESAQISIIAEDEFGNRSAECNFQLFLTPLEVVEITSCPVSETLFLEENCSAVLPDLRSGVETNISAEVVQDPAPGTTITEETIIRFTATDANGNTDYCEISISVSDNLNPEITCPADKQFSFDAAEGFVVPDFRSEAQATDNCAFELIQDPAPGTKIFSGRVIFLTAKDAAGNETFCEFALVLTEQTPDPVEITSCAAAQELELEAECQAALPDYTSEITTTIEAEILQEPSPGTVISEETIVRFTATDANGNTDFCEISINVSDNLNPEITCPADKQFSFDPAEGFVVPDFRSEAQASDNCAFELIQDPAPGTRIYDDRMAFITAIDAAGNETFCEFALDLTEQTLDPVEITSCAAAQELELEAECQAALPDFTSEITTTIEAEILQEPSPGTVISEETIVRFTATDANGNTDFCEISINVSDNLNPEITCPADKQFSFDPAEGLVVPDFRSEAQASDNCAFELIQDPAPGTRIYDDRMAFITAIDAAGNKTFCEFALDLTEQTPDPVEITSCAAAQELELEAECQAVLPDLISQITTNIEAEIIQEPSPGTVITEETIVRFTATDANGNTDFCEISIGVADRANPEITCPADKQFSFDPAEGFVVPDFRSEAQASDNCAFELIQDPAPGTKIFSDRVIFLTAKDAAGNETFCEFALDLTEQTPDPVEITSCAASQVLELEAECRASLPDFTSQITTNIEAEILQDPSPGTVITEETIVRFTATDANGNTDFCEISIGVADRVNPEITCPADKQFSFDAAEGFVVPDFRSEAQATDNCAFELIQDPAPGTTIFSDRVIFLTAKDAVGNETFCEFAIDLTETVPEAVEITSCAALQVLELEAECRAALPDYASEITTTIEAEIIQEPSPGTVISEETIVRFTATDANGNTDFCEISISVSDNLNPEITCPGDKEFSFDAAEGFVVPDFRSEAQATDNCAFELIQDPAPGTTIFSDRVLFLTAKDAAGNETFCEFAIDLTETVPEAVEITSCAAPQVLELEAECRAALPDYTSEITTTIDAEIVQEPSPGTMISEETIVRFTATDVNGNSDSCEIIVNTEDNIAPEMTCPGDIMMAWDPEEGYMLPDLTENVWISENCGGFNLVQDPAPGTILQAEQTIKFLATDASGNTAECSFWLHLSEEQILSISCPDEQVVEIEENCGYVMEDFTTAVTVNMENAELNQNPVPGTLIFEDTEVTFTATAEGQNTSCSFALNLKDSQPPEAKCVGILTLVLNEQGTATLTPGEIDNGSTDNCGIVSRTLSENTFSVDDVGVNVVKFSVFDAAGNESSCETEIVVEPNENAKIVCVDEITLQLNADRRAVIDPRLLFTGGTGTVQYSVSKEEFTCADLGSQEIQFSYTTPYGGGTCGIRVNVEDPGRFCELIIDEPEDPGHFVIISPNPGKGLVEIYTSADIAIEKATVFDMRGRFLLARDFSTASYLDRPYSLDLRKYQSGVYTIELETNSGKFIRRAIIKND